MANESNIAGERHVDKGDSWRHFDNGTFGAIVAISEAAAVKLPAKITGTVEKKKNQS